MSATKHVSVAELLHLALDQHDLELTALRLEVASLRGHDFQSAEALRCFALATPHTSLPKISLAAHATETGDVEAETDTQQAADTALVRALQHVPLEPSPCRPVAVDMISSISLTHGSTCLKEQAREEGVVPRKVETALCGPGLHFQTSSPLALPSDIQAAVDVRSDTDCQRDDECDGLEQESLALAAPELNAQLPLTASKQPAVDRKGSILNQHSFDAFRSELEEQRLLNPFEIASTIVILLNAVFLLIEAQFEGYIYGSSLGVTGPGPLADESVQTALNAITLVFTIAFVIEFVARFAKSRCELFYHNGVLEFVNIFDAILVVAGCIEAIGQFFGMSGRRSNISLLRPFRLVRLLRSPAIRHGKSFVKLRVLCVTLRKSLLSLLWSMVLVWSLMLFGALFFCNMLRQAMQDEAISIEDRIWVFDHFGTVSRSYYTFIEITFSGAWPSIARPLIETVSSVYAAYFAVYITLVLFALFRIISALFLKDTLAVAAAEEKEALIRAQKNRKTVGTEMLELFQAADSSGEGELSLSELELALDEPQFSACVSAMGLGREECVELFNALDQDSDGQVAAEVLIQAMTHLKENPRSLDVAVIKNTCHKIKQQVDQLRQELEVTSHPPS